MLSHNIIEVYLTGFGATTDQSASMCCMCLRVGDLTIAGRESSCRRYAYTYYNGNYSPIHNHRRQVQYKCQTAYSKKITRCEPFPTRRKS
jgi:hypothetical protein